MLEAVLSIRAKKRNAARRAAAKAVQAMEQGLRLASDVVESQVPVVAEDGFEGDSELDSACGDILGALVREDDYITMEQVLTEEISRLEAALDEKSAALEEAQKTPQRASASIQKKRFSMMGGSATRPSPLDAKPSFEQQSATSSIKTRRKWNEPDAISDASTQPSVRKMREDVWLSEISRLKTMVALKEEELKQVKRRQRTKAKPHLKEKDLKQHERLIESDRQRDGLVTFKAPSEGQLGEAMQGILNVQADDNTTERARSTAMKQIRFILHRLQNRQMMSLLQQWNGFMREDGHAAGTAGMNTLHKVLMEEKHEGEESMQAQVRQAHSRIESLERELANAHTAEAIMHEEIQRLQHGDWQADGNEAAPKPNEWVCSLRTATPTSSCSKAALPERPTGLMSPVFKEHAIQDRELDSIVALKSADDVDIPESAVPTAGSDVSEESPFQLARETELKKELEQQSAERAKLEALIEQ